MPISFRDMDEGDIDTIAKLESQVEETPWSKENFLSSIKSGYIAFVGENNAKEIVSWCVLMPAVDVCELLIIGVAAANQGQGLGRATLNHAIELARKKSFVSMYLEVRQSNIKARRLYESNEFFVVGERKNYYEHKGQKENAILMTREFS